MAPINNKDNPALAAVGIWIFVVDIFFAFTIVE
jgi:hypothetical protein